MSDIYVTLRRVNQAYIEQNYKRLLSELYPARREAVERFKNKRAACVSVTAGLLLQETAERVLGLKAPELLIGTGTQGKPYIIGCEQFEYNISHSGEYVVLAYGEERLGIDIEQIGDKDIAVARRCFTQKEYDYVIYGDGSCDGEQADIQSRFSRIWTMKESYLKMTGEGISVPLNSFEVNPHARCVENTEYRFFVTQWEAYHIAVCAEDVEHVRIIV